MKSKPKNLITPDNNMPLFDLPVDFIVLDDITGDLLKPYKRFPCKLEICAFAYVTSGSVSATINLWDYNLSANDLVVIVPGTFIQIKDVSPDLKISIAAYSSSFVKNVNLWKSLSPIITQIFSKPIYHLSEELGFLLTEIISLVRRSYSMNPDLISPNMAHHVMNIIIETISQGIKANMASYDKTNNTREQQILHEFLQLVSENYREQHKISFYAQEVHLTLSHFCNVISKATGMTAQEIIMNMIIMDAKTQLKASRAQISTIAYSLGFSTPTSFTRYFRTYTGMTPQEYRNSN